MSNDISRCTDWTPAPGDLDENWAWRTLDGLGRDGAIRMLHVNPSTLTEVLYYSKGSCLFYYLGILLDYLLSDEAEANFAAAAGFMNLLDKKNPSPAICVGAMGISLLEGARIVASKQDFYDADEDIFGSFQEFYKRYKGGAAQV